MAGGFWSKLFRGSRGAATPPPAAVPESAPAAEDEADAVIVADVQAAEPAVVPAPEPEPAPAEPEAVIETEPEPEPEPAGPDATAEPEPEPASVEGVAAAVEVESAPVPPAVVAAEAVIDEKPAPIVEADARTSAKAADRAAGDVDGVAWSAHKPTIAALKRESRFEDAVALIAKCVDAAERAAAVTGASPSPWPTEQMSIVQRRLKDLPAELAYLERYAAACGDRGMSADMTTRLTRARLAAQSAAG